MKAELGCGTEVSEAETAANGKGQLMGRAPAGKHTARKPPVAKQWPDDTKTPYSIEAMCRNQQNSGLNFECR